MHIRYPDGKIRHAHAGDKFTAKIDIKLARWKPIGMWSRTMEYSLVPAGTVLTYTGQDMSGSDPGPGWPMFKTEDGVAGIVMGHDDWGCMSLRVMDFA